MLDSTARWLLAVAVAEWLRGRVAEAERAFTASITGWRAVGERYSAAYGYHHLAQAQRAQGRLDTALGTYQQALEITAAPGRPAMPAAGIAFVGMGEVAYQRNELEAAVRQVTEGIERCRQLTYTQPLATGLAALAWIRQAHGDHAGALEAMGEAGRVAPGPAVAGLFNPVPAQRARLLLAQDRPAQAVALLGRLHAAADAQGRTGSVIEIAALQALALAATGEENAAVDTLAQALMLACPQSYVRVFADEGPPMSALLARLIAAQQADQAAARDLPLGCLAQVLRAFDGKDAGPGARREAAAAVPGLVEQLTARELEILVLLATGTPNPRIAEELVITVDTVKKHVSHLLAKLGAANRTEAVTRARQLGLIP